MATGRQGVNAALPSRGSALYAIAAAQQVIPRIE
jgi:hypothetical protein